MRRYGLLGLLLISVSLWAEITPDHFKSSYQHFLSNPDAQPDISEILKQNIRFQLYCGLGQEGNSQYFAPNRDALIAMGIPAENIEIIRNAPDYEKIDWNSLSAELATVKDTHTAVEKGYALLTQHLPSLVPILNEAKYRLQELKKNPRKTILVGHSKGGAVIVAMALLDPEFVLKYVPGIFPMQGTLRGSEAAQEAMSYLKLSEVPESVFSMAGFSYWTRTGIVKTFSAGIESLIPGLVDNQFRTLIQSIPTPLLTALGRKLHYVMSSMNPWEMPLLLQPIGWYLHLKGLENDGAVPVKGQFRKELGCQALLLGAHHWEFTNPSEKITPLMKTIVGASNSIVAKSIE